MVGDYRCVGDPDGAGVAKRIGADFLFAKEAALRAHRACYGDGALLCGVPGLGAVRCQGDFMSAKTARYVHWQAGNHWLGYFEEFPDYMTQGETLEDLQDHLRSLHADLTSGEIEGIRRVRRAVSCFLKRVDLVRKLEASGCELIRHGGNHD